MTEPATRSPTRVGEYATPILQRAPRDWPTTIKGFCFVVLLLTAMIQIHAFQLMLLPLAALPATRPLFASGVRFSKAAFGICVGEIPSTLSS